MKPGLESDRVYLAHMQDCIGRIIEYAQDDEVLFRGSRLIQDAVVRNLQTLAESSQRLSEEIKATEPAIPWRAISGFRNILVHDYLSVDIDAIWLVVHGEIPLLMDALMRMSAKITPSAM